MIPFVSGIRQARSFPRVDVGENLRLIERWEQPGLNTGVVAVVHAFQMVEHKLARRINLPHFASDAAGISTRFNQAGIRSEAEKPICLLRACLADEALPVQETVIVEAALEAAVNEDAGEV